MKTLAIKLEDPVHAQLALIAQVHDVTLADVLRHAVEEFVERKRSEGDFAARAATVLEELDRESAARRQAIQAMLAAPSPAAAQAEPTTPEAKPARGRKPSGEASA